MAAQQYQRPFFTRLMQILLASSKEHAFLDRPYYDFVFKVTPRRWRQPLANYLMGLSPHYLLPNWEKKHDKAKTKAQKLTAEQLAGLNYRKTLVDALIVPHVTPQSVVLDFGCGPGVIAGYAALHSAKVYAVDNSRGVIAICKAMSQQKNIEFVANRTDDLKFLPNGALDLAFSYVVLQHLKPDQVEKFLAEFHRALKPGGKMVIQMMIREENEPRPNPGEGDWLHQRLMLRMVYYSRSEMDALLRRAGFTDYTVTNLRDYPGMAHEPDQSQIITATKT